MIARWLFAILVLPGTVLIAVPLLILWLEHTLGMARPPAALGEARFWVAALFAAVGGSFGLWTMSLFWRFGNGTPVPWDPPRKLVVRGPYRHVRNPMIVGVLLMLVAEVLFFNSWLLAAWAVFFFVANSFYFPLVEEPGLAARFGDDYRVYCRNVGRWIPRLRPWRPDT